MKRLLTILLLIVSANVFGQIMPAPSGTLTPLTTNQAYFRASDSTYYFYNGTNYLWNYFLNKKQADKLYQPINTPTPLGFSLSTGYGLVGSSFNGSANRTWTVDTTVIATKSYSNKYVPYDNATKNVNLGEFGIRAGYALLDTTPTNTPTTRGTIYWNDSRSTAALIMNGTRQDIGQASFFYVKNSTGTTIPKGTAVRFAGTDGNSGHILIAPFLADGTYPSSYFMGVTSETITNGSFGQVMNFGELEGVNTNAYVDGDLLYASTSVAGGFQTTAPVAPNNIVLIAAVISASNNGKIIVRPTYGSNINDDEGVKITNPIAGDLLQYKASGLWENEPLDSTGLVTIATNQTITGAKSFNTDITTRNGSGLIFYNNGNTSSTSLYANGGLDNEFFTILLPAANGTVALSSDLAGYVPTSRTLTINGTAQDLSTNRTWNVGTVTSVSALTLGTSGTDLNSTVANGTTTPTITLNVPTASATNRGALSSSDWTTFNNKQNALTLTTTGTSGAATLVGSTLNIPQYADGGVLTVNPIGSSPNANGATIAGTALNLEPASASFGGVMTTSAQSLAGVKTFTDSLLSVRNGSNKIKVQATGASQSASLDIHRGDRNGNAMLRYFTKNDASYRWQAGIGSNTKYVIQNATTGSVADALTIDTLNNVQIIGDFVSKAATLTKSTTGTDNVLTVNQTSSGKIASFQVAGSEKIGIYNSGEMVLQNYLSLQNLPTGTPGTDSLITHSPAPNGRFNRISPTYYATSASLANYLPLSGGTLTGALNGTSATFSGKIAWGTSTYSAGVSSLWNQADNGTLLLPKAGSTNDFTHLTAAGGILWQNPTGTNDAVFEGSLKAKNTIYSTSAVTEASGYQLNSITMGYSATGTYGWITAGGAAARTSLVLNAGGGNVLIGTTTDAGYKLDVNGVGRFTGNVVLSSNASSVSTTFGGVTTTYFHTDANGGNISVDGTNNINFRSGGVSGTRNMVITGDGNVLIGTTTNAGYKLDVNGTGRFNGDVLFINQTSGTGSSPAYDVILKYGLSTYLSGIEGSNQFTSNVGAGLRFFTNNTSGGRVNALVISPSGEATFSGNISAANLTSTNYTPTLTNGTNVSSSSVANAHNYTRVGNYVTVYGVINVTTSGSGATTMEISLPIASDFTTDSDCQGYGYDFSTQIDPETTNNRAKMTFSSGGAGTYRVYYSFNYLIK